MDKLNNDTLKEQILKDSEIIFSKHPEEKFRRVPTEREIKYPVKDFLDLKVYSKALKKNIKLKTYLFIPELKDQQKKQEKPEIKGIVFMVHGMQGYAEPEAFIAKRYTDLGCIVAACDHRGHGSSEGKLGDIEDLQCVIDDYKGFMTETEAYLHNKYFNEKEEDSVKFLKSKFLCGLSMGGLLCYYLSKDTPHDFKGVIFFAPAFDIHENCITKFALNMVASCCPSIKIPENSIESDAFKNPYEFELNDPLIDDNKICMRTVSTMVKFMERSHKEHFTYEAPFVIIIPGVDKLVPPIKQYEFYKEAKSLDKDCWYYPNMWHCVYGEEEVWGILDKLSLWIENRQ